MTATNSRRYRADYYKSQEGTGIGIVEYGARWDAETVAIHSLFIDKNVSNRDASVVVFQTIYNELETGQFALLQMNKYSYRKEWDKPYRSRLRTQFIEATRGRVYHANLLARDALKRGYDVEERFTEPFSFSVVQQEKIEKERGEKLLNINEIKESGHHGSQHA